MLEVFFYVAHAVCGVAILACGLGGLLLGGVL